MPPTSGSRPRAPGRADIARGVLAKHGAARHRRPSVSRHSDRERRGRASTSYSLVLSPVSPARCSSRYSAPRPKAVPLGGKLAASGAAAYLRALGESGMTTQRTSSVHLWSSAAAALIAIAASVSGCQPKQSSEHTCACICYKETATTVYLLNQSVSTTNECGNVNGSPCSGDSGGQHIDGKFANCGPNPNVALTFSDAIRSALEAKSASARESGSGGGHSGGTGTSATAGTGQ